LEKARRGEERVVPLTSTPSRDHKAPTVVVESESRTQGPTADETGMGDSVQHFRQIDKVAGR